MTEDFDVCVIGSGAGGGPVALTLAEAGHRVVVIEKGPWYTEKDFFKDEISVCQRDLFTPSLMNEPQVVEQRSGDVWNSWRTARNGWNFWNGNMVGGSTNLMSGFFHRMKPDDFRLKSIFGPVAGASVEDWPITYQDLEPYYDLVEKRVGVSGRVVAHPYADQRSSPEFPLPATGEHPLAHWIDEAAKAMNLHPFPLPRAILTQPRGSRGSCSYSNFCGRYGCATGAKGSSRAALLNAAIATGRCEIRAHAMASRIKSDNKGRAVELAYFDSTGSQRRITARIFVVACQAIETARLLLMSTGPRHPDGLANGSGLVGRNLLFATAASADGDLPYAKFSAAKAAELASPLPFINRAVQDWYFYKDSAGVRRKGGTLDFTFVHPNPIANAVWLATSRANEMLWGVALKREMEKYFRSSRHIMFEVFADWMPTPQGRVTLDPEVKDQWGLPVARVTIGRHPNNKATADFLVAKGRSLLEKMGVENIGTASQGLPATNLVAGTCRFGNDPARSVLNRDCRAHEVDNLYITDGSFMPTGGSVPFTWTIYANAFRVARHIAGQSKQT